MKKILSVICESRIEKDPNSSGKASKDKDIKPGGRTDFGSML